MAATLTMDKFRLLWYFEGACGKSHLRWDIYEIFVNDVWPQLNYDEREFIYTYIKRDTSWHWEGEYRDETPYRYWLQVLARFDPSNQYIVTLKDGRKRPKVDNAYLWEGKYYVGWNRYCQPKCVVKVEQKPFKRCMNSFCQSKERCIRFREYQDGDSVLDRSLYPCVKCDLMIDIEREYEEETSDHQ